MMFKKLKSYNNIIKYKKKPSLPKDGFSIIELIIVIVLMAIISSTIISTQKVSKLNLAVEKLTLYLNYTRYISFIDSKYDIDDDEWEKKFWTLKFQNCSNTNDGMYFVVYSDMSGGTAHYKKNECLKDPLNQKYLYSKYTCNPDVDESKNILLKKSYGVEKIEISCNTTSTIGQISFGNDGKIYSQLGTTIQEIIKPCEIKVFDKNDKYEIIVLEPKTGFIHKK